eukprot:jgi/Ulvmu1/5641/UM231_0004.1
MFAATCGVLALASPVRALLRSHAESQVANARDSPEQAFREWAEVHQKVYATEDERALRYGVWLDNLDYIESYNAMQSSHWLALSPHADLTSTEFESIWLGLDREAAAARSRNEVTLTENQVSLPDTVDWVEKGAVTEVKNQKSCGACWAFSTTGAIEGINQIFGGELVSLSEQELVDCDVGLDHGCKGGLMDHAFAWVVNNGGIDTEKDYKYHALQDTCNVSRKNRHVVTIDGYHDVPRDNPQELMAAVANQPVSVAVQANQRPFQLYGGGVLDGGCGSSIDHGVLVVGYGTDAGANGGGADYWKIKNSWSAGWGEDGYIRIARNMTDNGPGLCGIQTLASYPTKTTPNPPKPPPPGPPTPGPPPPLPPVQCDSYTTCSAGTTCCCQLTFYNQCFSWACCPLLRAVCCDDHVHCCPETAPICDMASNRCLPKGRTGLLGALVAGVPMAEKVPAMPSTPARDARVGAIRQM